MRAYLAGDTDIYAYRRALEDPVRLAVELEDRSMLVVTVTHDGRVGMAMAPSTNPGDIDTFIEVARLQRIGKLTALELKDGDRESFTTRPAVQIRKVLKARPDQRPHASDAD